MICTLGLLVSTALLAAAEDKDPAKEEMAKFQGAWKVASLEVEGEEKIGNVVKEMKLVFKDGTIQAEGDFPNKDDEDRYRKFTWKIDPSTTPKIIDITYAAGVDKGVTLEGIYQLDGDKMKICVRLVGKNRPPEFTAKGGSGQALVILERIKN